MATMVTLPSIMYLGLQTWRTNPTLPAGRTLVSGTSTGSRMAFIVRVPRSGDVIGVRMGLGTCTAPQDVKVALMDVTLNSTNPDNTDDAFRDEPASKFTTGAVFESGRITSDGTDSGTPKTVVAGTALAVTFRWVSASGTLVTFNHRDPSGTPQSNMSLGYTTRWGASAWFGSSVDAPTLTLIYADGAEEVPCYLQHPFANRVSNTHQVGSSPDEYGLYWQASITGLLDRLGMNPGNSTANLEWSVYDEASTVLARYTSTSREHVVGSNRIAYGYFDQVPIQRGSIYRFSCRPTTAANLSVDTTDITAAWRATSPLGPLGCLTTRTNDGAWTETITKLPYYFLGFSAVEQP